MNNNPLFTSPEWDSEDVTAFRSFLETRTGIRLVPKLTEICPALLSGGETNEILIRNGESRGFQSAVTMLVSLALPEPDPVESPQTNAYPALTDDAQWEDGHTLQPPTQ